MEIGVNHQKFSATQWPNQKTSAPQRDNVAFAARAEEKSNGSKALLYTALTALAATGVYIATRGKKTIPVKPVKPNIPENLSHLDMDLFKQFGKFEKGKAIFNGKDFSGMIFTKNGCKLTYHNGLLQKSERPGAFLKYYNNGKLYTIKHDYHLVGQPKETLVERLSDGTRIITKKRGWHDNKFMDLDQYGHYLGADKNHDIVTTIKPDGTVTRLTRNLETRARGIEQKYTYDKLEHLNSGKVEYFKKGVESTNYFRDPIKQQKIVDGRKVTEELNDKGEVVRSWITEFNPQNGVSAQIITEKGKVPRTIFRDKQGNVLEKCSNGENTWYYFWNENIPEMGKCSTKNPYGSGLGVTKDEILKLIEEKGLAFEV